jgi:hypothetical protein
VLRARTDLRLVPGAEPAQVAGVDGVLEIDLPVQVDTVRVATLEPGQVVERAGTRVELQAVARGEVVYTEQGSRQLLYVRALNPQLQSLERESRREASAWFSAKRLVRQRFAGEIASLEFVFAQQSVQEQFPFTLATLRPGTSGEELVDRAAPDFVAYSTDALLSDYGAAEPTPGPRGSDAALATTRAGPFTVALRDLPGLLGLMPRFEVRGPAIPNLAGSLSALELWLKRVRLRDGSEFRDVGDPDALAHWRQLLEPGPAWDEAEVEAQAVLHTAVRAEGEAVESLTGVLILRTPRKLARLRLAPVELGARITHGDLELVLDAVGRDRVRLSAEQGGERVLGLRAWNAAGKRLRVTRGQAHVDLGGWTGDFGVRGIPARLEVVVADEIDRVDYGFHLALAGP